jgi:hypothetical protein
VLWLGAVAIYLAVCLTGIGCSVHAANRALRDHGAVERPATEPVEPTWVGTEIVGPPEIAA